MLRTDAPRIEATPGSGENPGDSSPAVAVSAGLKALFAGASGLLLACGLGVLVWAITPSSGNGPLPLVRAAVSAFAAANGMTITIGRASLTLPPLMLTLVAIALLTAVSGRGRVVARDRTQEAVSVLTAAAVYGLVVTGAAVGLGTRGAVRPDQWWRPALLAVVVVGCTVLVRGDGWRRHLLDRLPDWVPVAVRLSAVTVMAVLGGGAITLVIGLVRSFGDASTVQSLAAPGAAGGFGLMLLGIAYLPNAVVAGAGYASGVGFTIGDGSYSPFGSTPVELPAVTLLTAAPNGHAMTKPALLLLLFPLLAALLVGRAAVRRLDQRLDRLFAVGGAALLGGFVLAMIAAAASGGVAGGEWSSSGVPPVLFGAVVALGVAAIGGAVAGVARVRPAEVADSDDLEDQDEPVAASAQVAVDDESEDPAVVAEGAQDADVDEDAAVADDVGAVEVAEEDVDASELGTDELADEVDGTAESPEAADPVEAGPVDLQTGAHVDIEETADAEEVGAEAVDETDQATAEVEDAAMTPAIPSPREEDVIAEELAENDDPDATLASGLSRRAKPRAAG